MTSFENWAAFSRLSGTRKFAQSVPALPASHYLAIDHFLRMGRFGRKLEMAKVLLRLEMKTEKCFEVGAIVKAVLGTLYETLQ